MNFGKKYRIVTDNFAGYECQVWCWWWPFWTQMNGCNTHRTIEAARAYIDRNRDRVVEVIEDGRP